MLANKQVIVIIRNHVRPRLKLFGTISNEGGDAVQARRLVSKDTRTLDGVLANPTLPLQAITN